MQQTLNVWGFKAKLNRNIKRIRDTIKNDDKMKRPLEQIGKEHMDKPLLDFIMYAYKIHGLEPKKSHMTGLMYAHAAASGKLSGVNTHLYWSSGLVKSGRFFSRTENYLERNKLEVIRRRDSRTYQYIIDFNILENECVVEGKKGPVQYLKILRKGSSTQPARNYIESYRKLVLSDRHNILNKMRAELEKTLGWKIERKIK